MLRRSHVWSSITYRDRVLCGIFDQLAVNAVTNCIPACILEEAKTLYKRVSDGHITRGANRSALIAASMYVACKRCGVPRSHKEIAAMFDLKPSQLTKACHTFHAVVQDADSVSSSPSDFVARFCSALDLAPDVVERVRRVVDRVESMSLACDAMPPSVVGGAIMLVCCSQGCRALALSKDAIAAVCLVAPVTIAKLHKRLAVYSHLLLGQASPGEAMPSVAQPAP